MSMEPISENFMRSITLPVGIIIYQFNNASRLTINTWLQVAHTDDVNAVTRHEHIRALYLIHPDIKTAPVLQLFVEAGISTPAKLIQSIAIVTNNSLLRSTIQIASKLTRINGIALFRYREDAERWLLEQTDNHQERGIAPYMPTA